MEVWGFDKYEQTERVQEKYLKCVVWLERETPRNTVREELKIAKLRVLAGMKPDRYENKMHKREEFKILQ